MNGPVVELDLLRVLAILTLIPRLHVHDLTAIVRAASWADSVREFQFLALLAHFQRGRLQIIMCPAAIAAPLGVLTLWQWCHEFAAVPFQITLVAMTGREL